MSATTQHLLQELQENILPRQNTPERQQIADDLNVILAVARHQVGLGLPALGGAALRIRERVVEFEELRQS